MLSGVLSPTRWKIRKAVKLVNGMLECLGLEKHPDKTFIGRIARGFDFLGYHFGPSGLSVAAKTVERLVARAIRLNEQGAGARTVTQGRRLNYQRQIRRYQKERYL